MISAITAPNFSPTPSSHTAILTSATHDGWPVYLLPVKNQLFYEAHGEFAVCLPPDAEAAIRLEIGA